MRANPVSVIVADTQFLFRRGVIGLFQDSRRINLIGEALSVQELIEKGKSLDPDVIILGGGLIGTLKKDGLPDIHAALPSAGIVIISSITDRDSVYSLLQNGTLGYLTGECDEEEIHGAVIAAARGEKYLCHKVLDVVLDNTGGDDEDTCAPTNLTVRELEIVELTAKGLKASRIAEELFLSTHTVYTHRKNIMRKLGVHSASELILYAIRNGLATGPKEEHT